MLQVWELCGGPGPKDEQAIDLIHNGIYAFVTGAVADSLIEHPASAPDVRKGRTMGEKV